MILDVPDLVAGLVGKPRASGDDPERIIKHFWYSE